MFKPAFRRLIYRPVLTDKNACQEGYLAGIAQENASDQPPRNDVVGADTGIFGERLVIQQVDFIVHIGGHVFIELKESVAPTPNPSYS